MELFSKGSRELQDRYNARKVADAVTEVTTISTFDDDTFGYQDFIESASYFFLATSSGESTDCSFKGGPTGFVKIIAPDKLIFPDYDGNRMYKSLGNIMDNPNIGMLFLRFDAEEGNRYLRVRVNGTATLHDEHPAMADSPGAKRIIEVQIEHMFLNCPRYVPHMELIEESRHIPEVDKEQPTPQWQTKPHFKDVLDGSS